MQGLVCSRTATHIMACALWLAPSTCTWVALPPSVHRRYDHPDRGIIFLLGAGTFAPVPCRLYFGGNIFQFSSVQYSYHLEPISSRRRFSYQSGSLVLGPAVEVGAESTAKRSRSVLGCWYCFVLSLFNKSSVVFESIRSS